MADTKITALTALTAADPANDVIPIVDVSDTTMAASGTTKKISVNNILSSSPTASGALTVTGLVTAGSATITGDLTVRTTGLTVNSSGVGVGVTAALGAGNIQIGAGKYLGYSATAYLTPEDNVQGARIKANNILVDAASSTAFNIASTTAMTLNSTGLGIGDSPASGEKLTVLGSIYLKTANKLKLDNASNNFGASIHNIGASAQAALAFTLGATQAMTLDASGNLLVGVTSASNQERLNLTSAVSLYVARVFNTASSGGNYGIAIRYSNAAPNNGSNEFLACSDSAASRAFIYSNGGIANYQANDSNLSDARTKTDIKPLISYWNKIKALELVTFKYKDQTHSDDNIGLIAQQVESVAPEFVSNDGFGETPADGVPLKTIYSTDLYHAAIKALQEAMTRIEVLESKLA